MTSTVLARKYRPRKFSEMTGQPHVVQALTHAIECRRLHHAYLFTGTRGIGKTTVSRIFAKSLNCTGEDGQGDITANPCGMCVACREIDADRYVDYIELDAASNRSIDEVRDLIERAAYKPAVGRFKVFMIDEAHQLTKDACNALLKTLEEPPEYLKFILATTDPERMLPTVLSRCLQFNLRPMAADVIAHHLQTVLRSEGVAYEEAGLKRLARAARGSMRDALSLTDQAIAFGGGRVAAEGVQDMLGAAGSDTARDIVALLSRRDAPAVVRQCEDIRLRGLSAVSVLDEMISCVQGVALAQAGISTPDPDDAQSLGDLAAGFEPQEVQLLHSILVNGKAELNLMPDEVSGLVMLLLRFLAFAAPDALRAQSTATSAAALRTPGPAHLRVAAPPREKASAAGETLVPATASPPSGEPQAQAQRDADMETELADRWASTVRELASQGVLSGLVRELAWQGQWVERRHGPGAGDQTWVIQVAHDSLRTAALGERLQAALSTACGFAVRLELQAGQPSSSPAMREAKHRAQLQTQAEEAIREDPLVRDLLAQFPGARVVPGSVRPA